MENCNLATLIMLKKQLVATMVQICLEKWVLNFGCMGGYMLYKNQGSKLKKSSGRLLATNWRNIVARCKFLVASLYNVNDAARSQGS